MSTNRQVNIRPFRLEPRPFTLWVTGPSKDQRHGWCIFWRRLTEEQEALLNADRVCQRGVGHIVSRIVKVLRLRWSHLREEGPIRQPDALPQGEDIEYTNRKTHHQTILELNEIYRKPDTGIRYYRIT